MGEQKILEEELDPDYEPTEAEVLEYAEWLGIEPQGEKELLWISRHGLLAKLPAHWKPCQNEHGQLYYFNFETGQSVWEHPCDTATKDLFERERARLLDVRASGGTYTAAACTTSSTGQIEPASCHSQDSTDSLRKKGSTYQTTCPAANSDIPEAQSSFITPHKVADSSTLAREQPLTTLSALTSPAYSAMAPSPTVDPAAHKWEEQQSMSRPEKAISAPPGVADCCDALGSTATEARCTEMPHAADAHSRHLAELKSLEDKFKLKLQERKASLEQAEEELLDADRHARIQLVQRRKQHQTEMRALAQTMEEELDARRATLEEENNAEIARWQTHLQAELDDKISAMQAAMKQQLDANKARVPDNTSAQEPTTGDFKLPEAHMDSVCSAQNGFPQIGEERHAKPNTDSAQQAEHISCQSQHAQALNPTCARRTAALPDTVALDNSENFPPSDADDVTSKPCIRDDLKPQLQLSERGALGLQQAESVSTTPAASSHAHKPVAQGCKQTKKHISTTSKAPFPDAPETLDEQKEHAMKKQAAEFLREQKRLIRRRQAAMHKAREEWQRNAEILEDVYPNTERDELVRVLTQVHHTLEDQAKHLNQDAEQLAVMKERLGSGSIPVPCSPVRSRCPSAKATLATLDRSKYPARSVEVLSGPHKPGILKASADQHFPSSTYADAENLLENHAQWLRSLREKITKVSRPGGGGLSISGRQTGTGNVGGLATTPVSVRVGHDRELIIRVQSSIANSP